MRGFVVPAEAGTRRLHAKIRAPCRRGLFPVLLACLDLGFVLVPIEADATTAEVLEAACTCGAAAIVASEGGCVLPSTLAASAWDRLRASRT